MSLKNGIRSCITAPPGHVLVVVDAAQIEARGVAKFAGQADLLRDFELGHDVYSVFAGEVLAVTVRKARKDDPPAVAKLLTARRALGKVGILGMGYGMGCDRALEYMETYPELGPKIESGEIDLMFCRRFVDHYRTRYAMVPRLWNNLENAFRATTKYGEPQELYGLRLTRDGSTTVVRLPSGRCLFYPHASVSSENGREKIKYHWGKLWGGTLVENVVQSASRDVLGDAILWIEDNGPWRVVLHVHDEVVLVVPKAEAEDALALTLKALRRRPAWAPDWPLDAEGQIMERYSK